MIRVWRAALAKRSLGYRSVRWQSDSSNVPERKTRPQAPQKQDGEYVPPQTYQRVTYEYPPPPTPEPEKPSESTAYKKHIPILVAVAGVAWAAYAYKHFIHDSSKEEEQSHLDPSHFVTFKLTFKEEITPDLALIELSPKHETYKRLIRQKGGLWNGKKLWSVDVKQPEIQVVRKYTPLPLYYQQYYDGHKIKSLLRMVGNGEDEGRMMLLVKKYDDGEVSRYIHGLEVGSEVEIRGPFVGYKFPYSPIDSTPPRDPMDDLPSRMLPEYAHPEGIPLPDNVAFFAAGTGIAPILQALMSHNPPRGKVDVYYSVRNAQDIPLSRFMLFLEKAGRAKFHYFVDKDKKFLTAKDVPEPVPRQYVPNVDPSLDAEIEHELKLKQVMEDIRKERYGETAPRPIEDVKPDLSEPAEPQKHTKAPEPPAARKEKNNDEVGPRRKYRSILDQVADSEPDARGPAIAVVCGPEGYIDYVAGKRGPTNTAPIGGLLGKKQWDNGNAFRMES